MLLDLPLIPTPRRNKVVGVRKMPQEPQRLSPNLPAHPGETPRAGRQYEPGEELPRRYHTSRPLVRHGHGLIEARDYIIPCHAKEYRRECHSPTTKTGIRSQDSIRSRIVKIIAFRLEATLHSSHWSQAIKKTNVTGDGELPQCLNIYLGLNQRVGL